MYSRILLTAGLFAWASTAQRCYFPDGTLADSSWAPCNAASDVSHCCNSADACLDNGYCFVQRQSAGFSNREARGACTDKDWSSPSCPAYCRTAVSPNGQQSIALVTDDFKGNFCCGFGTSFYNSSECVVDSREGDRKAFELEPAKIIFDRRNGSTTPAAAGAATVPTTIAAQTATITALVRSSSNTQVIAAGVGAAVPLGCLLIAAVIFVVLLRRQVKMLKDENKAKDRRIEAQKLELELGRPANEIAAYKAPPAFPVVELASEQRLSELYGNSPN